MGLSGTESHAADSTSEILVQFILEKFDELVALVGSLDDESANRDLSDLAPAATATNSPVQLLTHVCGMLRRWSSEVNLGVPVPRDRAMEFTAQMPVAEILALATWTRARFLDDVAATDMTSAPAAVPGGRNHFWARTCHGVLLHLFEEICQHLGHAEITRDVLTAQRDAPR